MLNGANKNKNISIGYLSKLNHSTLFGMFIYIIVFIEIQKYNIIIYSFSDHLKQCLTNLVLYLFQEINVQIFLVVM